MGQTTNKKKKKVHIKKAAAFLFVVTILFILAVNVITKDKEFSEKENRMLQQKPKASMAAIQSGRFMEQYESYKADQFAGRDLWVALKTNVDLLLGKREENGVFKGKNSYLLEDIAKPNAAQVEANLQAIKGFAQSNPKIPMYMMLVPNAANVMADKLPNLAVTENQSKEFNAVKKELGKTVQWVDAESTLKKHRDEKIYYHTDHHWTTLGAFYAYEKLASVMKLDLAKAPQWKPYAVSNDFNGTLSATSGYEQGFKEPIYIYTPENVEEMPEVVVNYVEEKKKTAELYDTSKLKEKDKYAMFLGGNYSSISIRTTSESSEKLLLIKDSYANCFIPFLTPFYREIIVIDPRYYYGDIKKVMSENKISSVLFLYNGNTFMEDNSISGVLNNNETK